MAFRRLEGPQVLRFGKSEAGRQTIRKLFAVSTSAWFGARANARKGGGRSLGL